MLRICLFLIASLAIAPGVEARASWLSDRIDAVRYATGLASPPLLQGGEDSGIDGAVMALQALPEPHRRGVLAASASPEGHWTFRNVEGEQATAANADEIVKVFANLNADLAGQPVTLIVAAETVWRIPSALTALPQSVRLKFAYGERALTLVVDGEPAKPRLHVEARPHVLVRLDPERTFTEALAVLERPLRRGTVRLLTLEPGAARFLPDLRPRAADGEMPHPEAVDPYKLRDVFRSIGGATVLLSGAVEGRFLRFEANEGGEQSVLIDDIRAAATANDIDLVILDTGAPRQAGVRNILWQRSEVAGFAEALSSARYGDFLSALGEQRGRLLLTAAPLEDRSRFALTIRPAADADIAVPDDLAGADESLVGSLMTDVVTSITGELLPSRIEAELRNDVRQRELDRRLIAGVPSDVQWAFVGLWGVGALLSPLLWPAWRHSRLARSIARDGLGRFVSTLVFVVLIIPAAILMLPLLIILGRQRREVSKTAAPVISSGGQPT